MREIKFRAWDSEREEMATVISMGGEDITLQDDEGGIWDSVTGYIAYPMQYTGLKDKNGVEIYEGDIVRCVDEPWGNEWVNEVKIVNGCAMFGNSLAYIAFGSNEFVNVIGNIHEHPHLLENK